MKTIGVFLSLFLVTALTAACAFAGAPDPVAAVGVPALAGVSGFLAGIPLPALSMGGMFVIELVGKLWPTAQPQGWLLWVSSLLKKGAVIMGQLSDVAIKLDGVVGSLIPQSLVVPPKV